MGLRFYNTLTRSVEEFSPIRPPHVGVYACGPTVYQAPHIGNFRTFLFNDLLRRTLAWKGYQVRFVMNLTDVDDKTINGALARGVSLADYTAPIAEDFLASLRELGAGEGVHYPRATHHVPDMVRLIERLVERGRAYTADDGSVYYDISSFPGYGKLSRIDVSGVRAGAGLAQRERGRVSTDEYDKEDVRDFVLWKAAKDVDHSVGAVWDTPWGAGRPGWHIECSAMSMAELGESFDIHTGGEDLVFPHHEDEIAQSEGATGKPFVRYWLHVKHLKVNGQKMSKSLGNVYTIDDLREQGHTPAAIRYLLLSAHYRNELDFTHAGLEDARAAIRRVADFRDRLRAAPTSDDAPAIDAERAPLAAAARAGLAQFDAAISDDLDVPAALAALFGFVREGNAALDRQPAVLASAREAALAAIADMDRVLGILELEDRRTAVPDDFAAWVEERIRQRTDARARRDFATADAIRDELTEAGVVVEDTPQGVRWKKA